MPRRGRFISGVSNARTSLAYMRNLLKQAEDDMIEIVNRRHKWKMKQAGSAEETDKQFRNEFYDRLRVNRNNAVRRIREFIHARNHMEEYFQIEREKRRGGVIGVLRRIAAGPQVNYRLLRQKKMATKRVKK